ncbi:MAG: hypothetical protein LUQ28_15755 [Methylococcaceae bacterium]|nr:hypothetical protein [Methylococcaceae bacterium]
MTRWHIFAASWLLSLSAHGAGPAVVAKADRQLWQEPINSIDGFDKASRATLLVYIVTLNDMQKLSDTDMKAAFKIKTVNHASVTKWFNKELALTILNCRVASKNTRYSVGVAR